MTILTKNHAKLTEQVAAHIAADALVKGQYWQPDDSNPMGGRGCFISCLTHCSSPAPAEREFGLPIAVQRIAENIFENIPDAEGTAFFAALPAAVGRDGKDLSRVVWGFLAAELRALPPQECDVKAAVEAVIAGMDMLFEGKPWPAADAAALAALAADAADLTAYTAVYAARIRQRDTLLRLIAEAPMGDDA